MRVVDVCVQLQVVVTRMMTVCGTPLWTAPEVLMGRLYNEKADVFSFGLCIWELFCFTLPYSGEQPH